MSQEISPPARRSSLKVQRGMGQKQSCPNSPVQEYPDSKPCNMHIREDHPPRKGCNRVSDAILQVSFMPRLGAQMNDRANIPLDHFVECRVVFLGVCFFFHVQLAWPHKIYYLSLCLRYCPLVLFIL